MILYDTNQAIIAATSKASSDFGINEVTLSDVRHYFLRLVVEVRKKFAAEYGPETVLAFDSITSLWRKDEFPYYKFSRKDAKANMPFDMEFAKECIRDLYDEMKLNTHFKCIRKEGAEGDDVIGVIIKEHAYKEGDIVDLGNLPKFLIVSSDEDFLQCQQYAAVDQYSSIKGAHVRDENPRKALFEKIVRGDRGDGIPSSLSPDDQFVVENPRQKSITAKHVDAWYEEYLSTKIAPAALVNFARNKRLIDFDEIPAEVYGGIIEEYKTYKPNTKMNFVSYLTQKKVRGFDQDLTFF